MRNLFYLILSMYLYVLRSVVKLSLVRNEIYLLCNLCPTLFCNIIKHSLVIPEIVAVADPDNRHFLLLPSLGREAGSSHRCGALPRPPAPARVSRARRALAYGSVRVGSAVRAQCERTRSLRPARAGPSYKACVRWGPRGVAGDIPAFLTYRILSIRTCA